MQTVNISNRQATSQLESLDESASESIFLEQQAGHQQLWCRPNLANHGHDRQAIFFCFHNPRVEGHMQKW